MALLPHTFDQPSPLRSLMRGPGSRFPNHARPFPAGGAAPPQSLAAAAAGHLQAALKRVSTLRGEQRRRRKACGQLRAHDRAVAGCCEIGE